MLQSDTCFHHVFTIFGLTRLLGRGTGGRRVTHHFRRMELTPPGKVRRLNIGLRIIDDLLYSSVEQFHTYPSKKLAVCSSPFSVALIIFCLLIGRFSWNYNILNGRLNWNKWEKSIFKQLRNKLHFYYKPTNVNPTVNASFLFPSFHSINSILSLQ
jgi:hypothetical protein